MSELDMVPGAVRRLAEEMDEDGVRLPDDPALRMRLLDELDYARRIPAFEGRRPSYGSFVLHAGAPLPDVYRDDCELVPLDGIDLAEARAYADGRSAFLVRPDGQELVLVCFRKSVQYEADLVALQEVTGAEIVQRTVVLRAARWFTRGAVVAWDGRSWVTRPTASAVLPALRACAPTLRPDVARGALELAVHWLSPGRIGATIVVYDGDEIDWSALDTGTAEPTPPLSVTNRQHYPALFAALLQHDLAMLVSGDGRVSHISVGLRPSRDAESVIADGRGMRHRSAHRFSYDQHDATVIVVSEDGPVTIFRRGRPIEAVTEPCPA